MDKKGEIDYLSKIIKPDVGVITKISYAHAKNFKSLLDIAKAKSEIIFNIRKNGTIILNKDDNSLRARDLLHYSVSKQNYIYEEFKKLWQE